MSPMPNPMHAADPDFDKPVERRGGAFPPAVIFKEEGAWVAGIYLGESTFPGTDGKPVKSYLLRLTGLSEDAALIRAKEEIIAKIDEVVALSGSTLAGKLLTEDVGRKVKVVYQGTTKTRRGLNPAKIFEVLFAGSEVAA